MKLTVTAGREYFLCQEIPVDFQITVFEHIEDHPLNAGIFPQEFLHGPDGNLAARSGGKRKTPVEMQQKAMECRSYCSAGSRQER